MEYNTSRSKMNISEYGRNIQKMIEHIMSVEDREKRNQLAKATINVMGQLNGIWPEYPENDRTHHVCRRP